MSRNKKITLSIFIVIATITSLVFLKLAFGSINSPYLKEKISSQIYDISGRNIKINEVKLRLIKGIGLAIDIPHAEIYLNDKVSVRDTIVDINILSILSKGIISSEYKISSKINLYKDQSLDIVIISKNRDIVIKKLSSDNFFINEEIHLKKNDYQTININTSFSKSFIDQNFNEQLMKIYNEYGFNPSDLFFETNTFYNTKVKINLRKQKIHINKLENIHKINLQFNVDYSEIDKKIKVKAIIPNVSIVKILNLVSSKRATNNNKILKILSDLIYKEQVIESTLRIDKNLTPKEIEVIASGIINFNYQFDENADPSFLKGKAPYKIILYKENLLDDLYKISSNVNLANASLYIRQINLQKKTNENLNLKIDSSFDLKKNIVLNIESDSKDNLSLNGKIRLSEDNELLIDRVHITNNDNVDIKINGNLKNRNLITKITGNYIDLSKNLIKIDDKLKDYYYSSEVYEISSKVAYLNGNVIANNFKVDINKKKNEIKVQGSGDTKDSNFEYLREKNTKTDITVISSGNIINALGANHSSRNILKNGKATVRSNRIIGSLETNVEIDLENFVLINSPTTLKILSLPSFSGLSSTIKDEAGIEFAYGKITYKVDANQYSDINAFAVNDGIGLVLEGNIDRKNQTLNLDGQVSPLHLLSGIIQKIPIFGKILIGNEGEGILAVEYSMSGSLNDPEVKSNPLTIFKPRLFERIIEFLLQN